MVLDLRRIFRKACLLLLRRMCWILLIQLGEEASSDQVSAPAAGRVAGSAATEWRPARFPST